MKAGIALFVLLICLGSSIPAQEAAGPVGRPSPFHDGLVLPIASKSDEVQGLVLEGMGHLLTFWDEAAYRDFRKALSIDPDCLMANWGMALSLIAPFDERSDEKAKSLESLQRLMTTTPVTEQEAMYSKALHALLTSGPQAAASVFGEISERWRNDHIAVLFRAMMLREGFDRDGTAREGQVQAREILDRLIEAKPDLFAAHFVRALIEETSPTMEEETLKHAMRAVELAPEYAPASLLLGHVLFRRGDYSGAEKSFDLAAGLFKNRKDDEQIPMADNDGYFRSMLYRATSEWCRGDEEQAMKTAVELASIPVDEKRPLAKGTLIQQWEAATLPARLKLSRHPAASSKELGKMIPLRRRANLTEAKDLPAAVIEEFARANKANQEGSRQELNAALNCLNSLEEMLAQTGEAARQAGAVSYWARSLWMAERMTLEAQTMMFPGSAEIWLQNAVDSQQYASLLLPPVLPYPAELSLAVILFKKNDRDGAVKACEAGLKRFPNHAGLLRLMKLSSGQSSSAKKSDKKEAEGEKALPSSRKKRERAANSVKK